MSVEAHKWDTAALGRGRGNPVACWEHWDRAALGDRTQLPAVGGRNLEGTTKHNPEPKSPAAKLFFGLTCMDLDLEVFQPELFPVGPSSWSLCWFQWLFSRTSIVVPSSPELGTGRGRRVRTFTCLICVMMLGSAEVGESALGWEGNGSRGGSCLVWDPETKEDSGRIHGEADSQQLG